MTFRRGEKQRSKAQQEPIRDGVRSLLPDRRRGGRAFEFLKKRL
jgi:hypothetical protein